MTVDKNHPLSLLFTCDHYFSCHWSFLSPRQPIWKISLKPSSVMQTDGIPASVKIIFCLFFFLKDAAASYDFNDNDPDPFPRYDSTNENKWVISWGAFWYYLKFLKIIWWHGPGYYRRYPCNNVIIKLAKIGKIHPASPLKVFLKPEKKKKTRMKGWKIAEPWNPYSQFSHQNMILHERSSKNKEIEVSCNEFCMLWMTTVGKTVQSNHKENAVRFLPKQPSG